MAYATVAEVRAISIETATGDPNEVDDALVTDGISWAEELIDDFTRTSWELKAFSVTLDGNGRSTIRLVSDVGRTVMYPATVTSSTIDGDAVASAEFDTWELHRHGVIARPTGLFPSASAGRNIVIAGTAGATAAADADIARATKLIARGYCLDALDRTHMGALTVTDDRGVTVLAMPGKHGPTTIPIANSILKRKRRGAPGGMA